MLTAPGSAGRLNGRRGPLVLALLLTLGVAAVGHHDPLELAAGANGGSFTVAPSATHSGAARHVEASKSVRHDACAACLLQRQAGTARLLATAPAARPVVSSLKRSSPAVAILARAAGAERGRAPPPGS